LTILPVCANILPTKWGVIVKLARYTFKFKPQIKDFLLKELSFNSHKMEKEIFELILCGKTCIEIGDELGYSERTIQRRRKELYYKTKDYML